VFVFVCVRASAAHAAADQRRGRRAAVVSRVRGRKKRARCVPTSALFTFPEYVRVCVCTCVHARA